MTATVFTPAGLLFALEAVGVIVELNATGDGLKVTGTGRPPADLLASLKTIKSGVLAYLASQGIHSMDTLTAERTPGTDLPAAPDVFAETGDNTPTSEGRHIMRTPPPVPDWERIATQPGYCGSCGRSSDASQEWGRSW